MAVKCVSCDFVGNISNAMGKCQACSKVKCLRCKKEFRLRMSNTTGLCSECVELKRKKSARHQGAMC